MGSSKRTRSRRASHKEFDIFIFKFNFHKVMLSIYILNGKKPEPQYAVPNLPLVTYYSYVLTCLFFCELRNARFKGKRVSTKKSSVPRMKRGGCAGPGGGRARGGGERTPSLCFHCLKNHFKF